MEVEDRLTEVEMALAYAQRTVDELNRVVIEQGTLLATMRREIDRMKEQVADMLRAEPIENARPPHH